MNILKNMFSPVWKNTRGNALVISTITVTFMSLSVIGVATLAGNAGINTFRTEQFVSAEAATYGSAENAMFDMTQHSQGYEIHRTATNFNSFQFGRQGYVQWWLRNRAHKIDFNNSDPDPEDSSQTIGERDLLEYGSEINVEGAMVHPAPGQGTDGGNWVTVRAGASENKVNLYVDNTSRSVCAADDTECREGL